MYSCFGQCVRDRSGGRCTCHISISGRSGIVAVYDVSDGDDCTITIAKSTGLQGRTKKKIQQKGLIGLGVLSICSVIYPACSTFIAWILILQIVEVGVVVMRENYLNYKDMDAPPSMSEEAEKLFMECTRNYEARMNGLLHYPTEFRSMTRKERTSAFKGFTDQEKDAVMNLMTDEQKERLVQDIRYQAVLDFRRGK